MTFFLFSLAGIPPLAGWFAKLFIFRAVASTRRAPCGVVLAVVVAVNSVIALFYYANVAREMWMSPVPDDDRTPDRACRPRSAPAWCSPARRASWPSACTRKLFAHFGDISPRCVAVTHGGSPA